MPQPLPLLRSLDGGRCRRQRGVLLGRLIDESVWDGFPNLKRWVDALHARPAVDKGYHVGRDLAQKELTEEEEKARRELLFNQTNEKVRKAREEAAKAA